MNGLRIADRGLRIAGATLKTAAVAGMIVLMYTTTASGQTTAPTGGGEIVLPVSLKAQLGTITGVIVLSLAIVELLKRLLAKVPYAQLVPIWCYAVAVANVLALLAKYALGTLPGDTIEVLWQASLGAATASGFYTWIRQTTTGPEAAAESKQAPQRSGGGWTGVLLACLAIGATTANGCNQTASQRYVAATHAYSGVLGALTTLSKAGMIPLADMERVEVVRVKAAESLDRMKAAVLAGDRIRAEWYLREANNLLDELLVLQIRGEQRKAAGGGKEQSRHDGTGNDRGGVGRVAAGNRSAGGGTGDARGRARGDPGRDRPGRDGEIADRERLDGDAGGQTSRGRRPDGGAVGVIEQAGLRETLAAWRRGDGAETEWD